MVRTNLQEFGGDVHVLSNLQVGSNLFANDLAANVLSIAGNVAAEYFIGDGGFLSNIATTLNEIVANPDGNSVSNTVVFISGQDPIANTAIVTYANVGISVSNTNPSGEYQLSIGSNIFVNTHASNVLTIIGSVGANTFIGDGGLLSNIATTIDQIIDQGNTVSNTLQLISGMDATSNTGLVTHKDVGISVSNVNPTGEFQFGVGSNLFVNTYSSNVLSIEGNVNAQKMTLGTIAVTSAYGLNHVTAQGSATGDTISLTNATTGLSADSNIVVGGNVTAQTVITSANVEIGDRLKFASNVFVDDLRIADLAANLVTYDKTTGELMDSGGLFANKLAVVSVQPPSALSANVTTVAKHGTYTLTTSGLLAGSNTWNAFDGAAAEWTSVGPYDAGGGVYSGTSNLFAGSAGDWLAIEFPYKTTLRHMKLTPPAIVASYPASANIYATNDSLTWTEVAQWEDADPVTSSNVQTIIVNASESYKRYAMVATKSNGSTSNVALGEWKLFAESFSIDGGQISMAQQPTTGGETVMDQHGPHSRGAAKLKKYPEIAFDASKLDGNDSTNTYVQAGYTVSSSRQETSSGAANFRPYTAFDGLDKLAAKNKFWLTGNFYTGTGTTGTNGDADQNATLFNSRRGEWIQLETPNKIKVNKFIIKSRTYDNISPRDHPKSGYLYASNNGTDWQEIKSFTNLVYVGVSPATSGSVNQSHGMVSVDVNSTDYYRYFRLQVTQRVANTFWSGSTDTAITFLSLGELEYYGYEEDPPLGDTSVDTTFTSIMNTPQTTGAQVYVDGSLGETFTNRVVGPTVSNTHTTYVSTEKYWELSGNVESNVTLEANTFLSGDAPHSISMWFNSSNLEANVSNSCIFSLATEEKLDSVNLDLQSNTWHNLTYAYQGEGGSKVTYLDGRKVAEDQAEDTFGEYPPFAMTGYSQGGYVVSASSEYSSGTYLTWEPYGDGGTDADNSWICSAGPGGTGHYVGTGVDATGEARTSGTDVADTTVIDGVTTYGEWNQVEFSEKLHLSSVALNGINSADAARYPKDAIVCASIDGITWTSIGSWTGEVNRAEANIKHYILNSTKAFKYVRIVVTKISTGYDGITMLSRVRYYGHRENDLVRLPDPTNVLKYPHVAMTGPAQRGYVASASTSVFQDYGYESWGIFSDGAKSGWHTGESEIAGGNTFKGINFAYGVVSPYSPRRMAPETPQGEFLKLTLPNRIILNYITLTAVGSNSSRSAEDFEFWGSDTGVDGSWNLIKSFTGESQLDTGTNYVINATTLYKHIGLIITRCVNSESLLLKDLKLYGTEEDISTPLQIGGGNIDKVANFRVYDKFVGEDQALEIWDAQKDEFGRAKSSMTLHKGRLGIGTTEPEGRLAVADEPHAPGKFPPRAGGFDGDEWYIEGHGTFKACTSNYHSSVDYYPGRAFTNSLVVNFGFATNADIARWSGNNGLPNQSSSDPVGTFQGHQGDWLELELPYRIRVESFQIQTRLGSNSPGDHPKNGFLYGSNNRNNWTQITEFTNLSYTPSQLDGIGAHKAGWNVNSDSGFKYLRLLTTQKIDGSDAWLMISELSYFGTREQGQSVLHDGQLTLTKSLTVPRIGPALDADDTPRRDRLVVEYNTSTNPTFEGAVRDTSGRGNDIIMHGNAQYDATEKALVFDGTSGTYMSGTQNLGTGTPAHTITGWFKQNVSLGNFTTIFIIGTSGVGQQSGLLITNTGQICFDIYNTRIDTTVDASTGIWHHFAGVFKGGTSTWDTSSCDLYINGQLEGSSVTEGSDAFNLTGKQIYFGVNTNLLRYFNGSISNFKLYDTVLTAEEVKTLYDMGRCDEGHHVVNFSKTRVGIGLGDGEAPTAALDVRGENVVFNPQYESGTSSGRVGIGTSSPNSAFNFHQGTVFNGGAVPFGGSFSMTAYNPTGTVENVFSLFINSNNDLILGYGYNYDGNLSGTVGYFTDQNTDDHLNNFTGQHRTFIKDVPFSQVGELEGLIVSSDQNKYIKMSGGIEAGSNAITTNESLPIVSLSATASDKRCFGVISASEDPEERSDAFGSFVTPYEKEKGDTRVYINSIGEGAIWVVNTNGSLESGDYITTSNIAGYGQKQESDSLKNYTVAKITMDCDFNPATQPVQQILRSNVIQTYYLGNVHHTKTVPHEFVTTTVGADDTWSNVSVSPSDVTYAEWSNLEANTQNTYNLTYTQTSNVVYDTKYTLTTTANVTESDPWDSVFVDPPDVTYAQYSNLEANTQSSYSLTFTKTTTDEKTPDEWSALESNTQSLYNMVYYQSVEEEVASDYPGAVAHTRVTDVIENELDAHGQIQWEDHATETEKAYKIRYLDASGVETDSANAVHIAAFVGCTYHCG
jgi:hypothetical protein